MLALHDIKTSELPPEELGEDGRLGDKIQQNPAPTYDFVEVLPTEIVLQILLYLSVPDLLRFEGVCRSWYQLNAGILNYVWWKKCMEAWWRPSDRPKVMTRKDKEKRWKDQYARISPHAIENLDLVAPRTVPQPEQRVLNVKGLPLADREQAPADPAQRKREMRAYYKSVRAKPRNKGRLHRPSRTTEIAVLFDNSE